MRFLFAFLILFSIETMAAVPKTAIISQLAPINLTSAGTRQALSATDAYCQSVAIKAFAANTGVIYIGDVAVTTTNGFPVPKGDTFILNAQDNLTPINLKNIYFDGGTTNDDINVTCATYAQINIVPKGS